MTQYESEKAWLKVKIEMLKEAIDYLSESIPKAEQDLGPKDVYGVHDEVCEQMENGVLALKGKLFDSEERLKEITARK